MLFFSPQSSGSLLILLPLPGFSSASPLNLMTQSLPPVPLLSLWSPLCQLLCSYCCSTFCASDASLNGLCHAVLSLLGLTSLLCDLPVNIHIMCCVDTCTVCAGLLVVDLTSFASRHPLVCWHIGLHYTTMLCICALEVYSEFVSFHLKGIIMFIEI